MTDTQPEALRLATASNAMADEGEMIHLLSWHEIRNLLRANAAELRRLHAECEALRDGARAMRSARWYMLNKDGMATLCTSKKDAEKEARAMDMAWPHMGPHRAVQLVDAADVEALHTGYAAARLEIESLRAQGAEPAVAQQPGAAYNSTQATNCACCGEHKHTPLRIDAMGGYVCLTCINKKLSSLLGEFGYEKSPAQAAPAAVAVPVKLPFAIMDDELEALRRFDECARDFEAGGHDVRKEMMKRLAGIGLVRRVTANIYEHTTFGLSVLNGDFDAAPTTQPAPQQEAQEPVAGARCKVIPNCKSCQHSVGRLSCALAGKKFDSLARAPVPPEWCPLPLYTPQPSPAAQEGQ